MEHHPEVHGDALLNGEPSSPFSVRFGEKGPLWLEFTVRTAGAHGAYTHATASATKIAMALADAPRGRDGNQARAFRQHHARHRCRPLDDGPRDGQGRG